MTLELLVGPTPKIDKIAQGFAYTEGPVFSRIGFLLFSDVRADRIMRWDAGTVKPFREKSNGANGLTFDHQGRLLTCEQDRVTRTEKDGGITVLAAAFEGARLTSPNDLVYASDGSIYFSVIQPARALLRAIRACIRSRPKANCGLPLGIACGQTASILPRINKGYSLPTPINAMCAYLRSTAMVPSGTAESSAN